VDHFQFVLDVFTFTLDLINYYLPQFNHSCLTIKYQWHFIAT